MTYEQFIAAFGDYDNFEGDGYYVMAVEADRILQQQIAEAGETYNLKHPIDRRRFALMRMLLDVAEVAGMDLDEDDDDDHELDGMVAMPPLMIRSGSPLT